MRVAAKHKANEDWTSLFELCKECLSETDEDGQPNLLACDWAIWQKFIEAAQKTPSPGLE
jgi:hypothetical protein